MKIFLFTVLISCGIIYINGCVNTDPDPTDLTYVYIQHTAFTYDTTLWTPSNHQFTYSVTMQNIGTETATNIRTQVLYKKPSSFPQATNYLLWATYDTTYIDTTIHIDTIRVQIPPGGFVTWQLSDTVSFVDSVYLTPDKWKLSYNSNTVKNHP